MKLDNEADYLEWIATTHGIIKAFEHRGYALYLYATADSCMPMMSLDQLDDLISFGPVDDVLELGIRYIPLPLVAEEQRSIPKAVRAAAGKMAEEGRGPFFIDLLTSTKDNSVTPIGIYLVDSLYIEAPYLYLVIDSRFGNGMKGSIELPLATASDIIVAQMQMALRS